MLWKRFARQIYAKFAYARMIVFCALCRRVLFCYCCLIRGAWWLSSDAVSRSRLFMAFLRNLHFGLSEVTRRWELKILSYLVPHEVYSVHVVHVALQEAAASVQYGGFSC